jgi:hypothetical protein
VAAPAPVAVPTRAATPAYSAASGLIEAHIELYDAEGYVLQFGTDANEVDYVTVATGEPCGEESQTCPAKITGDEGNVDIPVLLHPNKTVLVNIKVMYANQTALVAGKPMMLSVGCEGPRRFMMPAPPPPSQAAPGTTALTVQAYWCAKKAGRHDRARAAEIATATAKLMPTQGQVKDATPQEASYAPSTVQGGIAHLILLQDSYYEVEVRLKEKYARSSPGMPFYLPTGSESEGELSIYFEPCERVVALFFVSSCGQPVTPGDVYQEGQVHALEINQEGGATLTGAEVGRVRFSSSTYQLKPNEIHIDERMAQAHVIEAIPMAIAGKKPKAREQEEFILELEKLPRGDAIVEVLSLSGEQVASLSPDPAGQYRYPAHPKDEFDFVLRVDGRVVERVRMKL